MADKILARTYAVFSDIHLPYEDKHLLAAALELLKDIRPHGVVLNGDVLDLPEVSRHNAGSVANLEGKRIAHSFAAGNKFLDALDAAAGPRCKDKHWITGNHEWRWDRWVQSGDNSVFADDEYVTLPARLRLKERGYKFHGDYPDAHVRLGRLLVTHGKYCGKYPAARHMERYQTSILVGHTHTQQTYHASTWDGQRVAYCAGHMADENSEAMAYFPKPRPWIQGFTIVHVFPGGDFVVQPINFIGGRFMYGSEVYPKRLRRAA